MKTIGDRISIKESKDKVTVVINTKIASWKESLLAAWIISWLVCLGVFGYELFQPHTDKERVILFGISVFMIYYAYRTIKVYLWRKFGMEYLKVNDDSITYKRSIKKYGKAHVYFHENIKNLGVVTKEDGSIAKVLENSFWVMGGERVSFDYLGRNVRIGLQLETKDAEKFAKWLNDQVKQRVKKDEIIAGS